MIFSRQLGHFSAARGERIAVWPAFAGGIRHL
jgi:hypothetical protein